MLWPNLLSMPNSDFAWFCKNVSSPTSECPDLAELLTTCHPLLNGMHPFGSPLKWLRYKPSMEGCYLQRSKHQGWWGFPLKNPYGTDGMAVGCTSKACCVRYHPCFAKLIASLWEALLRAVPRNRRPCSGSPEFLGWSDWDQFDIKCLHGCWWMGVVSFGKDHLKEGDERLISVVLQDSFGLIPYTWSVPAGKETWMPMSALYKHVCFPIEHGDPESNFEQTTCGAKVVWYQNELGLHGIRGFTFQNIIHDSVLSRLSLELWMTRLIWYTAQISEALGQKLVCWSHRGDWLDCGWRVVKIQ